MKPPDLLDQLRDHVRDERADDPALEALARGEAKDDRVVALEERAAGDPELAALVAASRPLDDEAIARIAARVVPKAPVQPAPAPPAQGGRVLALTRRLPFAVGPLALAAALLLYVAVRGSAPENSGAVLPEYALTVIGEAAMRGEESVKPASAPRLHLHAGPASPFEIVVRPSTSLQPKVAAYVFWMGEGNEPNPVEAAVDVSPEGSVRIRGRSRALEGAREVRIVLGTANDSIKRYEDALTRAREGKGDARVRVLTVPIVRE